MRVGFIGLGNMGGPLARRLVQRHQLTVHDRRPEMMQSFIDEGATGAGRFDGVENSWENANLFDGTITVMKK